PERAGSERLVETNRGRVPVEHRPLEPSAAPLDGEPRHRLQEGLPVTVAALLGEHEQILQVDAGLAEPGGVGREEEREAHGAALDLTEQALEGGPSLPQLLPE